ncbi:MAG: hypothetical protein MJE12_27460 [Alphaproteobacteria bacterium]|nr:hypothetical protein [Alphaproteobacteria bacterium]
MTEPELMILDSITRMDESHRGKILVAGSHGGVYAAYLGALARLRGVILNDAGVGKDSAGIGGLAFLDDAGIAGATVGYRSARIGDGADMMARGVISHVNEHAAALGCAPEMSCADCAEALRAAPVPDRDPPVKQEARFLLRANPDEPEVWGVDSNSLATPEDATHILITGSHGQLLGGRPETAIKHDVIAAAYNDAGCGIDGAGTSRLPALDARGIAAATVSHDSARIGDGRSTYEDGVVSHVNETAGGMGAKAGMTMVEFVDRVAAAATQ